MSFTFDWPRFSDQFHYDAIQMLSTALNKGNKPPIIADKIEVVELEMGTQPPELEIRDIGDLTLDQFRGIFRLTYSGDAHLVLKTKVQANPLNHKQPDIHLMGGSRGMLAAKQPLVVPMLLRLSHFRLSSYVVLVVSRQKGITLVFKTDPLQHVDINSTFDSIAVIQSFIQREIEGQLRQMFREDLPGIIHRLSQQWVKAKVEAPTKQPQPPRPGFQQPQHPVQKISKKASLSSLNSRRPRTSSHSSSTRPSFPSSASTSFSTAPSSPGTSVSGNYNYNKTDTNGGDSSPTPSSHPELENFDPTYGLRPEGLPAKSGFKAFSSLFTPNKGLAELAEETRSQVDSDYGYEDEEGEDEELYDDEEDSNSFDIVDWDDRRSLNFGGPKEPPPTEYETIPAVGGGTITRPRVYHSQSAILSSTTSLSSASTSISVTGGPPSASPRRTYSTNSGFNPYPPDGGPLMKSSSAASLLPSALPHVQPMLFRPATPGAGPSTLRSYNIPNSRPASSSNLNPNSNAGHVEATAVDTPCAYSYPYDPESSTDSGSYFSARVGSTNGKEREGDSPSAIYMRKAGVGYGHATPPPPYINGYSHHSPYPPMSPSPITGERGAMLPSGRNRRMSIVSDATTATIRTRTEVSSNYEDDVDDFEEENQRQEEEYGMHDSRSSSPVLSQSPPGSSYSNSRYPGSSNSNSQKQQSRRQQQNNTASSPSHPHSPHQISSSSSRPFKLNLSAASASIHQLSSLSTSNHTLSPYTRDLSHFTVRSIPPRSMSMASGGSASTTRTRPSSASGSGVGGSSSGTSPGVAGAGMGRMHVGLGGLGYGPGRRFGYGGVQERQAVPVKAKRKRTFRIGGGGGGAAKMNNPQGNRDTTTAAEGVSAAKKRTGNKSMYPNAKGEMDFDVSDMDRYFTHEQEEEEGEEEEVLSNTLKPSQSRQSTIRRPNAGSSRPGIPVGFGLVDGITPGTSPAVSGTPTGAGGNTI
ncbi:hypothetical protein D9613_004967 [Agrocybe pediades]|uniref:Mitochondrial distribution and morphology protein 34 n=1 Tax=Agrocybe pediades TaxID=84607 RepID=A0A8H4VR05_9AGAR|nr:hypothetical protein D9613_004967 [Agrocybe pediades]